ncbi:MAG: GIY-YIG nuclease family protein [Pseudomonadota bacterium]
MEKTYFTYLMASARNGTLYVGVTGDLARRIWEHKTDVHDGFTKTYGVHMLVWYETFPYIFDAIQREKTIKKWPRQWKLNLIEKDNPDWRDLYETLNH